MLNNKNEKSGKIKVLMELRPCLEQFAGIPQETRLVFHALNSFDGVEVTGLINHGGRHLWPGVSRRRSSFKSEPYKRIHRFSRLALSVKEDPIEGWWDKLCRYINKRIEKQDLSLMSLLKIKMPIYHFDAVDFGDFVWQTMFSKTLPARDYEQCRNAKYASIKPSWEVLNRIATTWMQSKIIKGNLPRLNTNSWDIFLTQTPWPTRLSQNTQLVVRYHDAIPIFFPHTISDARWHQLTHMANLRVSQKRGIFACTSGATREDLLKVYPNLEKRSVIIPDMVSHEYYEEKGNEKYISNIIRSNIAVDTEPSFLTSREKENFYQRNLMSKPIRFIMMVSTIEPRKNHMKLIGAWDYLRNHGMSDLKLVIVGIPGWDYKRIIESMATWQQRGELFHLQRVPAGQLRILYNAADAVICPSVAEGFDLCGIEAMLCGGAVVASDIPVHREVYMNACEYFNPYSALNQAKSIEKIIHPDNRSCRQELIQIGVKHAQRYRSENIKPYWHDLFERIQGGAFADALRKNQSYDPAPLKEHSVPDKSTSDSTRNNNE